MGKKINININGLFSVNYDSGITIEEVSHDYKKVTGKYVIGAKINDVVMNFDTKIYDDTTIVFFDYTSYEGNKIYQSGLKYITIMAAREIWGKEVYFKYSLDKGVYAEVDKKLTEKDIINLKAKMHDIADYGYKINKCVVSKEDAIQYYKAIGAIEKAKNIKNIPNSFVELFELNHNYNYFYSEMPPTTKELNLFNVERVGSRGFVLTYPRNDLGNQIPLFNYNHKIYEELLSYSKWAEKLNVDYVASLNEIVSASKIQMFIKMNNIYINDKLYETAKEISRNKSVKLVLIGGPSSSGKTTSSKKICTYLEAYGLKPIVLSADDYFKSRVDCPKDSKGNYNFEGLEALDLDLFNTQIKDLISGKEVKTPTFNFITGEKEYIKDPIKMNEENILIIEGLHCLNDKMTSRIPRESKYKILVCPFTPLGVDRHNHLSTNDMRLLRRIVRDNRTRGKSVEYTLKAWKTVKDGENKYIFPYENDIDRVLNTAFSYEVGVLRVYVEPLLYSVPLHSEYYDESRRLLGAIRTFFPISSEYIEDDNILREFIGGSIYEN